GLEPLVVQGDLISIDPATVRVDVAEVESLCAQGSRQALTEVGTLYQGNFLEGLDLREQEFNDWVRAERVRICDLAAEALKRLVELHEAAERPGDAIRAANRLLAIDPLQEHAYRAIMRSYLRQGERAQALKVYETCRDVLLRELGVEPAEETEQIRQAARSKRNGRTEGAVEPRIEPAQTRPDRQSPSTAEISGPGYQFGRPRSKVLSAVGGLCVLAIVAAIVLPNADFGLRSSGGIADLPDQPVVAVLPFQGPDGDAGLAFVADRIAKDVAIDLSRASGLLVLAPRSDTPDTDAGMPTEEGARDLGAHFVIEGEIQRSGDGLRIAARLTDTRPGREWTASYGEEDGDVFAAVGAVAEDVVDALTDADGRADLTSYERKWGRDSAGVAEYEYFAHGHHFYDRLTGIGLMRAREIWRDGLERFPGSGLLKVKLGFALLQHVRVGGSADPEGDLRTVARLAREGLTDVDLGPRGKWYGHWLMALVHARRESFDAAQAEIETALMLAPRQADTLASSCQIYLYAGNPEACLENLSEAFRLTPNPPSWYHHYAGWARYLMGETERAIDRLAHIAGNDLDRNLILAASYAELGQLEEAQRTGAAILDHYPDVSLKKLKLLLPYADRADRDRLLTALRQAGIPETTSAFLSEDTSTTVLPTTIVPAESPAGRSNMASP
ncbi:MAG TPA: BTAD domain-containing putative transcriptional regulator, partial [Kiloniellales bacterium]|nr:BTAD domain-containing putative transcriptional regulator [Kiloniellales bacterium]